MNNNRLFRNTNSKVLGGVASGIADYLDIDVTIVRVLFVLGVFIPVTFPIILFYIVLWIVMPDGSKRPKPLEENRYSA
ncbi:PspC domain-containing protein [Dyadobacter fanqingshengii]|uniref:PspC domain-containing protein n=1 Tax=Dyadobacter fanqingshengii TaxID=2906443 RepID=A0A9X1PEQ0_9BACT|nr:PspC domain-containing protein [Dyadobacter fanqingshengii]MCF0042390.1 PspC domain-containing protein [Dyadobacter fanqingshengii]MCF2506580.1 PspC domain-containing protein [Dyadobacter fanqingshengii]USJ35084.1 PspC domain-containing protein [Dyadobacter fanqingshengii]